MLTISVIIPSFNEEIAIAAAIESALAAGADEVLIADGGSTDRTKEVVAGYSECRFLACPVGGRGHQQAYATKAATGDVFAYLHADSCFHLDALDSIRDTISNLLVDSGNPKKVPEIWGGFRQHINDTTFPYRALEFGNWVRSKLFGLVYGDQGLWVTKSALEKIGGVPEIPIMEDVVMSQKLRKFCSPKMLRPKMITNARRWQKEGILKRTISNWRLLWRFKNGATPEEILKDYRPNKGNQS